MEISLVLADGIGVFLYGGQLGGRTVLSTLGEIFMLVLRGRIEGVGPVFEVGWTQCGSGCKGASFILDTSEPLII